MSKRTIKKIRFKFKLNKKIVPESSMEIAEKFDPKEFVKKLATEGHLV